MKAPRHRDGQQADLIAAQLTELRDGLHARGDRFTAYRLDGAIRDCLAVADELLHRERPLPSLDADDDPRLIITVQPSSTDVPRPALRGSWPGS